MDTENGIYLCAVGAGCRAQAALTGLGGLGGIAEQCRAPQHPVVRMQRALGVVAGL